VAIQNIDIKTRERRTESRLFPALDGEIIVGGVTKRILRHAHAISAHVRAPQVKDAYVESLNPPNLSFDIGSRGHR
jgi:hypothetical protein